MMEQVYRSASKEYRAKTKHEDDAVAVEKLLEIFLRNPIGITAEERSKKLVVGRWIWTGSMGAHPIVFSINGVVTEYNAAGNVHATGKWSVAKDATINLKLNGGWSASFTIEASDSVKGMWSNPQGKSGPAFDPVRPEKQ